jgi:hypothetical protein
MKVLFLVFMLVATPCFAEQWIKCIDTTIGTVTYEKPYKIQGDCLVLGLCTGANNTGLATNVFEAIGSEWNDAGGANKKCDRVAIEGSRVINLTAQEISDIADAQASELDSALRTGAKAKYDGQTHDAQALRCFAKAVVDENNLQSTKVNDVMTCVDNANTLATLKSCVVALSDLNTRTYANAVTAVKSCIDDGVVDE